MSVNSRTLDVLERYASPDTNPQFAAALVGAWGSGKTHFVRQFLQRREVADKTSVYVSLYGLADTTAIDQSIFAALHPILGGKKAQLAAKIAKGLLKATIKVDLDRDGTSDGSISPNVPDIQLADWLKPKKGSLIVFDDLERSAIDLDVVLGYINSLVEHCDIRCLILVSEDALIGQSLEKYRLRKEKTIGLTVKVEPDFDAAYKAFGTDLFSDCLALCENEWKPIVRAAFEQSGKNNLRLLRQALLYFSWAYDKFPTIAKESNDVVRAFLSVHLPTAFEFLSGNLNAEKVEQFIGTSSLARYFAAKEEKETDEAAQLAKKYLVFDEHLRTKSAVDFFTCLLRDGVVIEEKLNEVLYAHPALITASTPNWRRLWFWRDLLEADIEPLAQAVQQQLNTEEFDDLYVVLHATGTLISLATRGMTTSISAQNALSLGKKAVATLADKKDLHDFARVRDFQVDTSSGHDGLGFPSDLPEFQELAAFANELRRKQYEQFLTKQTDELLNLLSTNAALFANCISDYNEIFGRQPFFSRIDVGTFLACIQKQLTVAGYWDVSTGIKQRFIASNTEVYKHLLPELQFFETLESTISQHDKEAAYGPVARRGLLDLRDRGVADAIAQLRSCQEKVTR